MQTDHVYALVYQLQSLATREKALNELSQMRHQFPELAPIIWYSAGSMAAVLQEIISIYPFLSPPTLQDDMADRAGNALGLLQSIAAHPETRKPFIRANIPLFLYPFLNTVSHSWAFEYLRLSSLGVIGALVKVDDMDVVGFLLQTEIIPLSLRIMENDTELSRMVATFVLQKILQADVGLHFICSTVERFFAVSSVLGRVVDDLVQNPCDRLLRHVIRCYLRLAENNRAHNALQQCLPNALASNTFASLPTSKDASKNITQGTLELIQQMLAALASPPVAVEQHVANGEPGANLTPQVAS
eukprot:gnl/Trimastix_PCT/1775.p1 GENE.gnl/Trimastix_PCT/1775~~gnl/Trimastix_PCT/1775.p1  ORF type:complete len:301 (-),score=44.76 gnl/Trimastix_PCT/1775:14-916(-)